MFINKCKAYLSSYVFIIIILNASTAIAETPPTFSDAMGRFNTFMNNVQIVLGNVMDDPDLFNFINIEWVSFSIFLIVVAFSKYILGNLTLFDLIYPLIMVVVTRLLIDNYDFLTSLCWDMSEGIAGGIQRAAIGNSDPFLLPGFINDVMEGIEHNDVSWWGAFWLFISANIVFGIIFLFSILGFIANVWALWGYSLAKIIGLFFIPFIMLKRTAFLFDGWMRLFTGFLVYGVIARANLLLTVLAIKSLFGIPGYAVDTTYNIRWDFSGMGDIIGLAGFLIVGILALISTGRFATAVVSGAGGFGSSISSVAYGLTRVVRGGV